MRISTLWLFLQYPNCKQKYICWVYIADRIHDNDNLHKGCLSESREKVQREVVWAILRKCGYRTVISDPL